MKRLFSRIYLKLYASFVIIFLLTIFIVVFLSSRFYGTTVRREFGEYFSAQAHFLQREYLRNCGASQGGMQSPDCKIFLQNLNQMMRLRVWVISPEGKVLVSEQEGDPPVTKDEISRASAGEFVSTISMTEPAHVLVPVADRPGPPTALVVLERQFGPRHGPRLPPIFDLTLAALVLAVLVLPLSLRITRPVRELHNLAQEWSEGKLEKRAKISGNDEIAGLAAVFNGMAENLERMLRQRKEFLALISHELKSPLSRIKIAVEMLREKASAHDAGLLDGIDKEINMSEELIDQLLALSRIEMQVPETRAQEIDVTAVLKNAIQNSRPLADVENIAIQMEPASAQSVKIMGDALQLEHAFSNILENAIKFSAAGSSVETDVQRDTGFVRIRFLDQGVGMDPAEYQKVFEPFYRGI
ncbi:MAG TPA: HAMP domain-containing sensor histidine kinase, partial [Acidobacteriota bacterium]|nr:HAMP domain-containing sensor histidine kinase [Acidobacteriota bacterium]